MIHMIWADIVQYTYYHIDQEIFMLKIFVCCIFMFLIFIT